MKNFAFSALEVSKQIQVSKEEEDLKQFLTIFSLGDNLTKDILNFVTEGTYAFVNQCSAIEDDDGGDDGSSDETDGGDYSESEDNLCDLTDEYYDSDES